MNDIADICEETEGVHKAARIQSILNQARGKHASKCIDCESEIPECRRFALKGLSLTRCVGCQELVEFRAKMRA